MTACDLCGLLLSHGLTIDSVEEWRLPPFPLSQHENGSWHAVGAKTGGPAEIHFEGEFHLLERLQREEPSNVR